VEISRLPIHCHIWHDLPVDFHIDLIDIISDIFVMIRHHSILLIQRLLELFLPRIIGWLAFL
jgi:hypothetical protein